MTDLEFNALCAEFGITLEAPSKRYNVYVGAKSVTYFESSEDAEAEVSRLKANGHSDARFRESSI